MDFSFFPQVKYHEDFEKTKGRGFTPVVDDPVTERVRKNTQVVSDAAYKGVHPHIVEMDRRPGIIVGKLTVLLGRAAWSKRPCLPEFRSSPLILRAPPVFDLMPN